MVTAATPVPRTLEAVILPGWMERDDAVNLLVNECVSDPPLTQVAAATLWRQFRDRAEALPERPALEPTHEPLTHLEQQHAQRFMTFLRGMGVTDIQRVIKIDLSNLVIFQYYVITERAEEYKNRIGNVPPKDAEECLPTSLNNAQVQIAYTRNGPNSQADIDLPHAEFFFGVNPATAMFSATQFLRHVTVTRAQAVSGTRLVLTAGYHRSYARMLSRTPTAAARSALVALAANTLVSPPTQLGVGVIGGVFGLAPFGLRPALFADFFTDGLFMKVNLRRKRYQLQVRSTLVALDDSV